MNIKVQISPDRDKIIALLADIRKGGWSKWAAVQVLHRVEEGLRGAESSTCCPRIEQIDSRSSIADHVSVTRRALGMSA